MMRTINSLVFVLATMAGAPLVVPAEAQYSRRPSNDAAWQREAHDHGYQSGLAAGRDDARRGWTLDHNRHDAYRLANIGFRIGGLSVQLYQSSFRRGFGDGYRVGFGEARVAVGVSRSYVVPYPASRGGRYGNSRQGVGFDRGFADGYREGLEDARDGDRYDVYGQRQYRRGDAGYDRRFGSRERYKDDYRDGFRSGYERGYRESARRGYSNRGDWRRW